MTVRCINRQNVRLGLRHFHGALQKVACRSNRGAHAQATVLDFRRVRIFQFLLDILNVDEPLEVEVLIHAQQLLDAVLLQDALGFFQRRAHRHGHKIVLRHRRADQLRMILFKSQVPVCQNSRKPGPPRHRQPRDLVLGHDLQGLPQRDVRRDGDRVHDHPAFRAFYPVHLLPLTVNGHVAVHDPNSTLSRDGDGQARFGHRVHGRGSQRNVQGQFPREICGCIDIAWQHRRPARLEQHIVNGPISEGLTFDDVLLLPGRSSVLPGDVDTTTNFARKLALNIPLASAAMDTVTESRLAIAIARQGGIGIVHRNMPIDRQGEEVDRVKRSESGMIGDPVTISPDITLRQALEIMHKYKISGLPVPRGARLTGILTNRDLRFEKNHAQLVGSVMTKENLVTLPVGTRLEEAGRILQKHRIEKLRAGDQDFNLKGLITVKDIQKKLEYPRAAKDDHGPLPLAAAVGATGEFLERAIEMSKAKADVLAIDTAHGHTTKVMDAIKTIRQRLPEMQIVAGNVATYEAAKDLIALGIDGLKVGIGPGSICTTRVGTGAGVPQLTAIIEASRATRGTEVPIIADGGITYSEDITKALAAGASCVMIGSLFAGTEESPVETILIPERTFKSYRGMGSIGAMAAGSDRYSVVQEMGDSGKSVPEGVEGRVAYKGPLGALTDQLVGGLKS